MNCRLFALCSTLYVALGLGGGAADLAIIDLNVQWTGASKTASATIKNSGNRDAGPFEVYFTAEECPNSNNHRPQQSVHVPGLAAGAELSLATDFEPLAHSDNANLGRVYAVSVRVDPKNQVPESNEVNNWDSRPTQYDVSTVPLFTYDEAVTTILRGIQLDVPAAGELELVPGYYKISEHRVSDNPAERVIALHIFKRYFESFTGPSSPPRRDEAFVFSIIDQYEYDSTGIRFSGRDLHGHTLAFDIAFQPGCMAVNSTQLNCTAPRLTTQTYTTGVLNTCGVTSEPPWSNPLWE
jgi:hypothetical protein